MDIGKATARRIQDLRVGRGWGYEEMSKRSGLSAEILREFEITAASATLRQLADLASALDVTAGCLVPLQHPLEAEWKADAWDILSASAGGFRAKVCVLGKLAEWKLDELIRSYLDLDSNLSEVAWNDADDQPDFRLLWRGKPLTVECKNVRRDVKKPSRLRVELQKTRNSRDGSNTRSYRRDKFDVLAVCLYNQKAEWRFVFCPTKRLAMRPGSEDLLAIYHDVPDPASPPWTARIVEALEDALR